MTGLGKLKELAEQSDSTELRLILVQAAAGASGLREVLSALRDAFYAQAEKVEELRSGMPEEYRDWVTESEQPVAYGLFGAAFVTCQACINAVTQIVLSFREHIPEPRYLPKTDWQLRELGGHREIRAIHHLANYFKHVEEWTDDEWEAPTKKSSEYYTITFLKDELELTERNPLLLQEGARKLLIPAGQCIADLGRYFNEWSDTVVGCARLELDKRPRHSRKAAPE